MSNLFVLGFQNQYGAEGMWEEIVRMEEEDLIVVEDAVLAERGADSEVEVKQTRSITGKRAAKGTGIGFIAGMLLGGPIVGAAAGAAVGAISGRMKDIGIDDKFVDATLAWLKPDTSMLFVLVRESQVDEVMSRLAEFDATVLVTTVSAEQEKALAKLLEK
ncbi:MAG TPA: DUF1269 domain-containing protein [Anaerolineales bacterium]|nr:DUF1269 domain-containing protein [Anaerolineales bacterium]